MSNYDRHVLASFCINPCAPTTSCAVRQDPPPSLPYNNRHSSSSRARDTATATSNGDCSYLYAACASCRSLGCVGRSDDVQRPTCVCCARVKLKFMLCRALHNVFWPGVAWGGLASFVRFRVCVRQFQHSSASANIVRHAHHVCHLTRVPPAAAAAAATNATVSRARVR